MVEEKRLTEIRNDISSIYPEKIVFCDSEVRTARRNEFIQYINLINKKLRATKNGTKVDISTLSRQVGMTGFEPATPSSRTTYATGLRYIPNDLPVPQKYCENIVPANSLLFLRAVFCIFLFKQIFKRIFYRLLCILFCTLQRFF